MQRVAILVPRRAGDPIRDRLWTFTRAKWAELFPDWPIVEGHHDEGPFSRSAAVNRAALEAGPWDAAVVIDGDVLPDPDAIRAAVAIAATGRAALGFDRRMHLNREGTEKVLEGFRGSWSPFVEKEFRDSVSSAVAVSRGLWEAIGGFDELFVGWGWEDVAFWNAAATLGGAEPARVVGRLWHLWHPRSTEARPSEATFQTNRERGRRYRRARFDLEATLELIAEAGTVQARPPVRPPLDRRPTRIPRVLHRTVPEETSSEVEAWWTRFGELHPGWRLETHRDPLDPAKWPETGDLWHLCTSGAQRAGLIRLEALYRFGGIYVDSDVEPYRSFEPLLELPGFAAWEDSKTVPDAVLGFAPRHPAVAIMLERARAAILRGAKAWESGPGVTTATLPGRSDVLLLPPGSFFPYHYTEKDRRDEDHAGAQPWSFAAHHWHHSWRGR